MSSEPPQNTPNLEGKSPSDTFETAILGESTLARADSQQSDPPSFWTLAPGTHAGAGEASSETFPEGSPTAYVLHRMIARGGCGEVWEATQTSMGRSVAVKRMRADIASKLGNAESEFRQEAVTAAQLEHPNIVPVHDLGRDDAGRPVIAMKLVRGRAWSEVLREEFEVLSPTDFLARHLPTLMATTHAVAFAHSKGIVHRDLKPAQVMTGEFGEVLLMDWGLAIATTDNVSTPPSFNLPSADTASSPSGTPAYMAPEQTRNRASDVGPWTDIYLLGAILYDLLTGEPPHQAETAKLAFTKACEGIVVPPRKKAPGRDVPVALEAICLRALSIDPKDRHISARHFLDDLNDYVTGSTRRRDAIALLDTARGKLNAARGNYAELAEAMSLASRARELWPESAEPKRIEQDAVALQSQSALNQGDLVLARLQADRVTDSDRRQALLEAIHTAEEKQRALASQRRLAFAASFVLFAVLVVTSIIYSQRIAAERDAAEAARADASAQRDRAVAALDDTQELVSFMLTDLRNKLAPRDAKLELLDAVAERARSHYDTMMSRAQGREERRRLVAGLQQLGAVFRVQGSLQEAEKSFSQARTIALEYEAAEPGNIYWRRAASAATQGYAQTLAERGDDAAAIPILKSDMDAMRAVLATNPNSAKLLDDTISTASWLLQSYEQTHDKEGVQAMRKELLALADRLENLDSRSVHPSITRSVVLTGESREMEAEGKMDEARERMRGLIASLEEHLPTLDSDIESTRGLSVAYYRYGNMLYRNQDFGAAEAAALRGVELQRGLLAQQPGDLAVMHDVAVFQGFLAKVLLESGSVEQARKVVDEEISMLGEMLERDPMNGGWGYELAAACEIAARIAFQSQQIEAANAYLDRGKAVMMAAIEHSGTNSKFDRQVVQLDNLAAEFALRMGDHARAASKYRDTVNAMRKSIAETGNSPRERNNLANLLGNYISSLRAAGNLDEAQAAAEEELQLRIAIHAEAPTIDTDRRLFTASVFGCAELQLLNGSAEQAIQTSSLGCDYLREKSLLNVSDLDLNRRYGQQLALRARILDALNSEERVSVAQEAIRLLKPQAEIQKPNPFTLSALVWASIILKDKDGAATYLAKMPKQIVTSEMDAALTELGVEH
jgi:serine/threonine protein kinase